MTRQPDRDPAVEAAHRAAVEVAFSAEGWSRGEALILAAREALEPIRELHKPSDDECHCCRHCVECGDIGTGWPCDTARLIYCDKELSDD